MKHEMFACQCGKRFRSMSAEAFHRHNFPALCRRKPKAAWEVVAGLEWTREIDGYDNSNRPRGQRKSPASRPGFVFCRPDRPGREPV